jgi:hypothetical protein
MFKKREKVFSIRLSLAAAGIYGCIPIRCPIKQILKPIGTCMKTLAPRIHKQILLAAFSCAVALPTWAQEMFPTPLKQTTLFGISALTGYRFGGEVEDSNTKETYSFEGASSFGIVLDYAPLNANGRFELLWSHQESSIDFKGSSGLGNVDLTIDVIQVGGISEFGSERKRSYVSAHIGATHFSTDDFGNDTKLSLGIGAGVKAFLTKTVFLRADVRGYCTVVESEASYFYRNGNSVATFSGSTLWQGEASLGIGITF